VPWAALIFASLVACAPSSVIAGGTLAAGSPTYENVLEHRWSSGGLWSLVPRPQSSPRLQIRVGEGFRTRALRAGSGEVLLVWLPQAAGTDTGSELVARLATDRGWDVAALLPPADLPRPGAPIAEWISLLEQHVRSGRDALAMARVPRQRCVAILGASAGGIAALRVAELEPEVNVVGAMLVGSGAKGLLHAVRSYGASSEEPSEDLMRRLEMLDPGRHASELAPRPRLLVRAMFDEVIPSDSFERLRAALEEPAVHSYPTGHASFVYAMPWAVPRALDWIGRACDAQVPAASLKPGGSG
jgi:hypothetical protein